jgi:hypothetical protein
VIDTGSGESMLKTPRQPRQRRLCGVTALIAEVDGFEVLWAPLALRALVAPGGGPWWS